MDLEGGRRKAVGSKVTTVEKSRKGRITIEFDDNSQFENIDGNLKAMMKPPSDTPQKRDASSPQKAGSSKKASCREKEEKDKKEVKSLEASEYCEIFNASYASTASTPCSGLLINFK